MADGEDAPAQLKAARHAGAVCVVARLEADVAGAATLERVLGRLAAAVAGDEPRCTSFYVTRPIGAPLHFAVHARFTDWAAFKAHAETAHMTHALAGIRPALAAPMALEIFFEI